MLQLSEISIRCDSKTTKESDLATEERRTCAEKLFLNFISADGNRSKFESYYKAPKS